MNDQNPRENDIAIPVLLCHFQFEIAYGAPTEPGRVATCAV